MLARDAKALAHADPSSCANKAEVVSADEARNRRARLAQPRHTFGHAIETGLGCGKWLHGETIAASTLIAAELSKRLGWFAEPSVQRIEVALSAGQFAGSWSFRWAQRAISELMRHDKKVRDGSLRLVLLRRLAWR